LDVIKPYLEMHSIEVIDLLESLTVVGNLRSLSLPKELRTIVGKRVKFVEPAIKPEKIGWDLGEEVWLNVSNPTVRRIYERIRSVDLTEKEQLALSILISLVDNEFDLAISQCTKVLTASENVVEAGPKS
jgi:hypothetical protein